MGTTIDHLSIDHRVTILQEFTDATGITLRAGDSGILRGLSFDQIRLEIHIEIEREKERVALVFPLKTQTGPRNSHMREYFELGEYAPIPGSEPVRRDPAMRTMIVPPRQIGSAQSEQSLQSKPADWSSAAQRTEGPDRLVEVEEAMQKAIPYVGVGASIAEIYAQRMRAFQRAGNEPRAVAAFKLAIDWMDNNASHATSGGEGAALSYERDRFHAALVREFGYDPTEK